MPVLVNVKHNLFLAEHISPLFINVKKVNRCFVFYADLYFPIECGRSLSIINGNVSEFFSGTDLLGILYLKCVMKNDK